jgi:hypothetical protein
MQMVVNVPNHGKIRMLDLMRQLFQKEGWRGLWKGFSLNIVKGSFIFVQYASCHERVYILTFIGPITLSLSLTTYDLLREWIDNEWSWARYFGKHKEKDDTNSTGNNKRSDNTGTIAISSSNKNAIDTNRDHIDKEISVETNPVATQSSTSSGGKS